MTTRNQKQAGQIVYSGSSGYYYWRIYSYSGSGSYDFYLDRP